MVIWHVILGPVVRQHIKAGAQGRRSQLATHLFEEVFLCQLLAFQPSSSDSLNLLLSALSWKSPKSCDSGQLPYS